jgi:CHAD domain-containing protein
VVRAQIDRAIDEIEDPRLPPAKTVHQVRKRCKKLRALLRLAAPALGDHYGLEQIWYRDTARHLAGLRDAEQARQALSGLASHSADLGPAITGASQAELDAQAVAALQDCAARLREGRARVADWPLDQASFKGDLLRGFRRTYARGRKRLWLAVADTRPETLHQWRKSVKYHGYQLKLLRAAWPGMMTARYREVARLGEYLGDDHDLFVLAQRLCEDQQNAATQAQLARLRKRQAVLRHKALQLGRRVYAERPRDFARRLKRYWKVARARA